MTSNHEEWYNFNITLENLKCSVKFTEVVRTFAERRRNLLWGH